MRIPPTRLPVLALACIAAVAAGGCTLGPAYQRPDVPLPPAWHTAPFDAQDVANTAWWERFGDPQLDRLVAEAIEGNKDLQLAALRVEQFEARLKISRSESYPQATYEASAAHQRYSEERPVLLPARIDPIQDAFQLGTTISWELDLWGRVRSANEAARAELLATEEAQRGVMLTVVANVATSYFQLRALDRQLELALQSLKNRNQALGLAETRYDGGAATRIDVARAQAAVHEVAVAIPDLERQVAQLEHALSILLGRNPGPVDRSRADTPALPPVPAGVPSDVLARRPDVVEAEQALIAANARIGIARAEYFPRISLTGMLGLGSDDLGNLLQHSATTGSIGAGLLGTLFSGGRIAGDIRESEAVQRQMVVKYQQAVQAALRDVEDALSFRAKAGEAARRGEEQITALQDVARLSQVRYEGGQASYYEVLDAQRQLYAAEQQQVQRRRDTYVSLVSVYAAMGGGWMVDQQKTSKTTPARGASLAAAAAPAKTTPRQDAKP